jgi:hypothetical protein
VTQTEPTPQDRPAIWTVPHPSGGWGNQREGSKRFLSRSHRKDVAERLGRAEAKLDGAVHVITRRDGSIAERHAYDPEL